MTKYLLILTLIVFGVAVLGLILIKILIPTATVTSWFRTYEHNKAIGSRFPVNSRHLIGWGYDVVPPSQVNWNGMKAIFPKVEMEADHIHGQWI